MSTADERVHVEYEVHPSDELRHLARRLAAGAFDGHPGELGLTEPAPAGDELADTRFAREAAREAYAPRGAPTEPPGDR